MRVLLRNIASVRTRANRYAQTVPELRDQLRALSERLRSGFSVRLDLDDTRVPPSVTAQFDPGVRIYPRRFNEPAGAKDEFFATPQSKGAPQTYQRDGKAIVDTTED
jgi:hypothetical protein